MPANILPGGTVLRAPPHIIERNVKRVIENGREVWIPAHGCHRGIDHRTYRAIRNRIRRMRQGKRVY